MCFTAGLQVFYLRDKEQRCEETDFRKAETITRENRVLWRSLWFGDCCSFGDHCSLCGSLEIAVVWRSL